MSLCAPSPVISFVLDVSLRHTSMHAARSLLPRVAARFGSLARAPSRAPRAMASSARAASASTASTAPEWVGELRDRLKPRFADEPNLYWRGGDLGVGGRQVHGEDSVFGLLHAAGAFHDPCLLVDEAKQQVVLTTRTGRDTAGHPGITHGGFTSLLLDEMAGQAYCEFVQSSRGPGVTANLTIDYCAPMPTESHVLVVAKLQSVDGRKVRCDVRVMDGAAFAAERGEDGKVFAKAAALFVVLAKDQ